MGFFVRTTKGSGRGRLDLFVCVILAVATLIVALASGARSAELAAAPSDAPPGTIVVRQGQRALYLALGDGRAIRYPVAVGKPGKQWRGVVRVDGKYVDPAWAPPPEVKRAEPWLPDYIPGGASDNPMGHRALTLSGGEYAIHGTNRPWTVGTAASFGCIRMREGDIDDLFGRVTVGTPVVMLP